MYNSKNIPGYNPRTLFPGEGRGREEEREGERSGNRRGRGDGLIISPPVTNS